MTFINMTYKNMKYVLLVIYNINYRNVSFGITLYICICEIVHVNIFN